MVGVWAEEGRVLAGMRAPNSPEVTFHTDIDCQSNGAEIRCQGRVRSSDPSAREDTTFMLIRWDPDAIAYRIGYRDHTGRYEYLGRTDGERLIAESVARDQSVRIRFRWDFRIGSNRVETSLKNEPFRLFAESTLRRVR
jgi:hypothetical protein